MTTFAPGTTVIYIGTLQRDGDKIIKWADWHYDGRPAVVVSSQGGGTTVRFKHNGEEKTFDTETLVTPGTSVKQTLKNLGLI